MQTSHAFITRHRARIAESSKPSNQPPKSNRKHRPDEKSKNTQRFTNFLKGEIKFYTQLVGKMVKTYRLDSCRQFLELLGETDMPFKRLDGVVSFEKTKGPHGSMFVKGIIFLGDLERYIEMYAVGKERDLGPTVKATSAPEKTMEHLMVLHRYELGVFPKAKTMYKVARFIDPDNGPCSCLVSLV